MITQFNNLSSWRPHDVTISPHEVESISFHDTMPNTFVISNPNEANIKVGFNRIPSPKHYNYSVGYNSVDVCGRPHGMAKLDLLNDSDREVTITVYSIETEFNPEILKNITTNIDSLQLEARTIIDGFGEGIKLPVELPSDFENDLMTAVLACSGNTFSVYERLGDIVDLLEEIKNKESFTIG